MLSRPFKNWLNTFQIFPKWRNFAKSGHAAQNFTFSLSLRISVPTYLVVRWISHTYVCRHGCRPIVNMQIWKQHFWAEIFFQFLLIDSSFVCDGSSLLVAPRLNLPILWRSNIVKLWAAVNTKWYYLMWSLHTSQTAFLHCVFLEALYEVDDVS